MWSDIETDKDLLGFSVHANLIKDVVTNVKNLPITIGIYCDWGSGKSSVLKILEDSVSYSVSETVCHRSDDAKLIDKLKSQTFCEPQYYQLLIHQVVFWG